LIHIRKSKRFSLDWLEKDTSGDNTHNVSATISIDKKRMYDDKNEWQASVEWMWENREVYNGLSVLDYDGGTYVQKT
jgi:ribonucleoside-diphosphate reductase alpha chain